MGACPLGFLFDFQLQIGAVWWILEDVAGVNFQLCGHGGGGGGGGMGRATLSTPPPPTGLVLRKAKMQLFHN